ncbi:hypothetical protein ACQKNX_08140 [Lysinibacillus sp. NPDC093712]|uniref:hypothetical protein n=1 Tax=Lysinibacillus sp. NPDC093712 TaxID=3390579 RepID=UPI003D08666F
MTSYDLKRKESESFKDYHVRLYSNLDTYSISSDDATILLNKEYGSNYSESKWRKDYGQYINWKDYIESKLTGESELPSYRQANEIKGDGTRSSDKLIRIGEGENLDSNAMLEAHGFNIEEFELVNAKNSIWNQSIDKTLYSSKITVKPKTVKFDINNFIEKMNKEIKPIHIKQPTESTDRLLVIPFVDLHFGINTCEYYQKKLNETLTWMESRKFDTIYIPIGNDLLHNNDHNGKTANGTQIETVDMDKATEEAYSFYTIIYENALKNAKNVVSDYIPGNHDSDISWMFVKMLSKQYPQIKWDTSKEIKKLFKWENILLINLHGEKGLNRVSKTLLTEYRDYVVGAKTVEIHSGHIHAERVKDEFGILVRTLPTSAKTDDWHRDMSFEGSVKTSQIFEYDKDKLKDIHYV